MYWSMFAVARLTDAGALDRAGVIGAGALLAGFSRGAAGVDSDASIRPISLAAARGDRELIRFTVSGFLAR